MKVYRIKSDLENWESKHPYTVSHVHKWNLPGVICPICGNTWANTGTEYPAVDLSALPNSHEFLKHRAVDLSEYLRLRNCVQPFFSNDTYLPPGAEFGPLCGKARGLLGDFIWPQSSLVSIRVQALQRLNEEGINVGVAAQTNLVFLGKHAAPDLVELQVERKARLSRSSLIPDPPCTGCGRQAVSKPDNFIVDKSTIPNDLDIFRMHDMTTYILGTERLKDCVETLGLTDISFTELSVD